MAFMCAVRVASVALVALMLSEKIIGGMYDLNPTAATPIHAPVSYGTISEDDCWTLAELIRDERDENQEHIDDHHMTEIDTGVVSSRLLNLSDGTVFRVRFMIFGPRCEFEISTLDVEHYKNGVQMAVSKILSMLEKGYRYGVAIFDRVSVDYFQVNATLMNPKRKDKNKTEFLEVDISRAKHFQFPDSATRDSPSTVNFSTVKSEKLLLEAQSSSDEHGRRDGNGNCYFIATMLLNNPGRSVGYYTDKLGPNTHIRSPSGEYRLIMQIDCNLVLYKILDNGPPKSMWSSKTDNQGVDCYAYLENNGVLTVRDKNENVLYSSHKTNCGFGESCLLDAALVVEEGNLVLYELNSVKPIWDAQSHP